MPEHYAQRDDENVRDDDQPFSLAYPVRYETRDERCDHPSQTVPHHHKTGINNRISESFDMGVGPCRCTEFKPKKPKSS